jgi:hypothetical protein
MSLVDARAPEIDDGDVVTRLASRTELLTKLSTQTIAAAA